MIYHENFFIRSARHRDHARRNTSFFDAGEKGVELLLEDSAGFSTESIEDKV